MKRFLFFLLLLSSITAVAQVQYEVSKDPQNGQKTLKGFISREILQNDTTFKWMHTDISWYKPNADCINNLVAVKDSVELLVFVGTWCEDSQVIFPQLMKLLEQAKFDFQRFTLLGVDRNKKTLGALCEALNVTKAPTILVMKHGKEIGRVEEYGKYGLYDKELGEVLSKAL